MSISCMISVVQDALKGKNCCVNQQCTHLHSSVDRYHFTLFKTKVNTICCFPRFFHLKDTLQLVAANTITTKASKMFYYFSVFSLVVATVVASPGGAPEAACEDLTPNHPPPENTGTAPFAVTTSAANYAPGDVIEGD